MEMLLIFLHCVTAFKEKYEVKIEHKSSNETVFNAFTITLDNIGNIAKYPDPNLINTNRSNVISNYNEITPFIQRKRDNEEIKKGLDKFVLERKRSHIPTVQFSFNVPISNIERNFVKQKKINMNELNNKIHKEAIYFNEKSDTGKKIVRELEKNKMSEEMNNIFKRPEMEAVLKRQNFLVDTLVRLLGEEKKTLRTNFNTLMEEMEKLKKENVTLKQEVIQGPITPATVVNIDETMVREALKNDPFVRRVLQMGKSKRDAYEREARIYNKG